jgi:hypothetical protein
VCFISIYFTFLIFLLIRSQIIDNQLVDEDKNSDVDEITKPMSTLNTTNSIKPSKTESEEKKKDKKAEKEYVLK